MDPYAFHLNKIHWQFFGTLSFIGEPKSLPIARSMLFRVFRKVARRNRIYFPELPWCLRHELGKKFGRAHLHILLAGLPSEGVTEEECRHIERTWRSGGGGIAKVQIFNPALNGVGYLTKGLGEDCQNLMLSHAVDLILRERAYVTERRLAQ